MDPIKIIDVSSHQNGICWDQVAASGVKAAMIRVGWGSLLKYPKQLDRYFAANLRGAAAAGLQVGVYLFSYAGTPQRAREEAQGVLKYISGSPVTFPVAFDWEYDSERVAGRLGMTQLTDCAVAFCEEIKAAGYIPAVYMNRDYLLHRYQMSRLQDYALWYAWYNPKLDRRCELWQSSSTGRVPGVSGSVDVGQAFVDFGNVLSDTTDDMLMKPGQVYYPKLTAWKKPDFTVGDGSVLQTFTGRQGRGEYIFGIKAVGKPGQGCGVYANGKRLFGVTIA